MITVNSVNAFDGDDYLVVDSSKSATSGADFDKIYSDLTVDNELETIFAQAAKEYGVDKNLLKAVAKAESGFDPDAVSYCGAQGIMQLMPFVSEEYGVTDPFDAKQSIDAGAKLLSSLLEQYDGNVTLALASYNAGSGNVQKYGGVPPFEETKNYIEKINGFLGGALDRDSWTIEGSSKTVLSDSIKIDVPDINITSNSKITSATYVDNRVLSKNSFEYNDNLAQRLYNEYTERTVTIDDVEEDIIDESMKSSEETGFVYNQLEANYNYLLGSYENLVKNDAQSLYQAQASVVSPLIQKLFYT